MTISHEISIEINFGLISLNVWILLQLLSILTG